MKNGLVKKGLVLGIILLFVGMSVVPTNASEEYILEKKQNNGSIGTLSNVDPTNLLAMFNITWKKRCGPPEIDIKCQPDNNYTYPEAAGWVSANFSVICNTWLATAVLIPRLSCFSISLWNKDDDIEYERITFYYFLNTGDTQPKRMYVFFEDIRLNTNGQPLELHAWFKGWGFPFGLIRSPEPVSCPINIIPV